MYIDYRKYYDSVPHSWLLTVIEIYKRHPKIVTFLQASMENWSTKLKVNTPNKTIITNSIKIQRGIFQGDALSPLWFCLALNPLSTLLNQENKGYSFKYPCTNNARQTTLTPSHDILVNHLLYMDDIKLYAGNEDDINDLANKTEIFSNDIQMQFGIDKCNIN